MSDRRISVIIVSYNSAAYISLCLDSIRRSEGVQDLEIIVVDNASTDQTCHLIRSKFSDVILIENEQNLGFSKACNLGVRHSSGSYLCFLNPDTIVAEDALGQLQHAASRSDIGIVGPRLINGRGLPLPESARALPTHRSALAKIMGLPFHTDHPYYIKVVDSLTHAPVLCGACMMIMKRKFDAIGGWDERFFMYGEDIDFSKRSLDSGWENYCIPTAEVIHFKGESTSVTRFANTHHFYNAIDLYLQKHQIQTIPFFGALRLVSLKLFAVLSFCKKILIQCASIVHDLLWIVVSVWCVQMIWSYVAHGTWIYFGLARYLWIYLAMGVIWIAWRQMARASLSHDIRPSLLFKYSMFGSLTIIVLYSSMDVEQRFSRAIIFISAIIVPFILETKRSLFERKYTSYCIRKNSGIAAVLSAKFGIQNVHQISMDDEFLSLRKRSIFIFDLPVVAIKDAIALMSTSADTCRFLFYHADHDILFGSDHLQKSKTRDIYGYFHLKQPVYRWQKRALDLLMGFFFLLPVVSVRFVTGKFNLGPLRSVLLGETTFIQPSLPLLKAYDVPSFGEAIVSISASYYSKQWEDEVTHYLADYTVFDDIYLIVKHARQIFVSLLR